MPALNTKWGARSRQQSNGMATSNASFKVPNGFLAVAEQLNRAGFNAKQDEEIVQESCPANMFGWRSWIVEFPNGESAYVLERGDPEPEILFNLYAIKDGHRFRAVMLESGAIEHWDGVERNAGFWWRRYDRNYRRRLGNPVVPDV